MTKDPNKSQKLNLDKDLKIFKSSLQAWEHRKLTFNGKKTILNTNALSKILHILIPIYVPPEFLKELNKYARNFLWSNGNNKIAFNDIIKPYDDGGLNFPSPELRIKSQKMIWIKKFLSKETKNLLWTETFKENI